jgi:uncharacterized protein
VHFGEHRLPISHCLPAYFRDFLLHNASTRTIAWLQTQVVDSVDMKLEGENTLLRIFLDKFQKWHHRPVYEEIVELARRGHMAGATVLEGLEGFGQSGRIMRDRSWSLSNDLEVIVEIVDEEAKIRDFLEQIEPMLRDAIVTLERAHVVYYRHAERKAG